jgi:hypothetical protein
MHWTVFRQHLLTTVTEVSPPVEQQDRTGWIGSTRSEASLGFRANLAPRDGGALTGADSLHPSLDLVGPDLFEFVDRHLIWLTEARKVRGCDVYLDVVGPSVGEVGFDFTDRVEIGWWRAGTVDQAAGHRRRGRR